MSKKQGKIIKLFTIYSLLLIVSYLLFAPLAILANGDSSGSGQGGFIPCGNIKGDDGRILNPCEPCHIFVLGQNILNFLWRDISIPIAILALIYAGFLMIIPGASSTRLEKGKKVLSNTLIGIAVVFFAWLAIDTIIKVLAGQNLTSGQPAQIQGYGPWNKIECQTGGLPPPANRRPTTTVSTPVTPLPPPGFVPAEPNMARALLQQQKITWESAGEDCAGFNAKTTIEAVAAGQRPPVCSPICQCRPGGVNNNITLSNTLLQTLDAAALQGLSFRVTSLTTGRHSSNSLHYQGKAVDLVKTGNTTYPQLEAALTISGATFVQCEEVNGGRVNCMSSAARHIHAEFR